MKIVPDSTFQILLALKSMAANTSIYSVIALFTSQCYYKCQLCFIKCLSKYKTWNISYHPVQWVKNGNGLLQPPISASLQTDQYIRNIGCPRIAFIKQYRTIYQECFSDLYVPVHVSILECNTKLYTFFCFVMICLAAICNDP